jgi:LPS-assembly lipoprotein
MSLFRTFAALFVVLLLGACGFRSLYGTDATGDATGELATIKINPIADRLGQQLRNNLLDLLNPRGRPSNPRYFLTVALDQSTQRLAIEKDAFATRANLTLLAKYSLQDPDSREIVLSGKSLVVSSYNILDSEFATLMAEKDAKARAAREIAHDIRTRLAAFFVRQGGGEENR